jgi:hypothetical protein
MLPSSHSSTPLDLGVAALGGLAGGEAGVGVDHVAVVALLAHLLDGVAALGGRAHVGAGVVVDHVAVVALLAHLLDHVAALGGFAHVVAGVVVDHVAVVALLDVGLDGHVAALGDQAGVEAGVGVVGVAVVALLDAVPTMVSPQEAGAQALVQASASSWLPSSHISPGPTMASPQMALVQALVQASASSWLPSSHSSSSSMMPSPQTGVPVVLSSWCVGGAGVGGRPGRREVGGRGRGAAIGGGGVGGRRSVVGSSVVGAAVVVCAPVVARLRSWSRSSRWYCCHRRIPRAWSRRRSPFPSIAAKLVELSVSEGKASGREWSAEKQAQKREQFVARCREELPAGKVTRETLLCVEAASELSQAQGCLLAATR